MQEVKKLAVIGKLAAVPNTGNGGSSNTRPPYVITHLQGLQEALAGQTEIVYDDGSDPVRAAQVASGAEVAIVVAGYTQLDEGEYVSPDAMAELSKNFPPPTSKEAPIAQAMMENMGATNSMENAMPPGGDRKLLTLHPEDEELIQAVAASNPRTVVAMMGGSAIITENWFSRFRRF